MTIESPPTQRYHAWAITVALVLLPIDWFGPTGLLLREAGAKPASPFLALVLVGLLLSPHRSVRLNPEAWRFMVACALVACIGSFSFGLNLIMGWSTLEWNRNPIAQFCGQLAMFLLFAAILLSLLTLLQTKGARDFLLRALPWVAALHLSMFALEASGALGNNPVILLFRTDIGLIDRASGLMSEPSYYGTFAALFGVPLMFTGTGPRALRRLLGMTLIATAVLVQAKTMFVVLAAQALYLLLAPHGSRLARPMLLLGCAIAGIAALSVVQDTGANNLDENMSTIMRVGSTATSMNVATAGYGVTGIGFGQFHFFYTPRFAPDFLFLSQEALDQFSHLSPLRASTYNLLTRTLVETGIGGFLLLFGSIAAILWRRRRATDEATRVGMLFIFGSIGFLTTQDTYCYPPLALGLALTLSASTLAGKAFGRTLLQHPQPPLVVLDLAHGSPDQPAMPDAPLFSIVTAARNARVELLRTAHSLAAQTLRDFEWIVIDGASTDGSQDLLPHLEGVTTYISELDRGIADAWNKGIARARGRQILILNAGDTYDPDMLAQMARAVGEDHITCCHARLLTEQGQVAGRFRAIPGRLWRGMHLPHNWCAVPRRFYSEYGAYKLMPHAMDYEWFHRIWRKHGRSGFQVVDQTLGSYYLGGHSDNHAAAGFAANERILIDHGQSRIVARLLRLAYTARHRRAQARRPA